MAVKACSIRKRSNVIEYYQLANASEHHPNLVRYLGFFETPDRENEELNLVLEWMRGGCNLDSFLRKRDYRVAEFQRVHIALSAFRGLKWLHDHNVVHGDLKPDNIIGDTDFWNVKLIDLGCAAFQEERHPEMKARGRYYPARDCGPVAGDDLDVFQQHVMEKALWKGNTNTTETKRRIFSGLPKNRYEMEFWLEGYKFHLLRHEKFEADLFFNQRAEKIVLKQSQGTFLWQEEVCYHLERAGAISLDAYCLFKVDILSPGQGTFCIIGQPLVEGDPVSEGGWFGSGSLHRVASFSRYIMPIENCRRLPVWPWEESRVDICLKNPIIVFSDTSCDMASCSTLPVLSVHEDFQILNANQPYVCDIPSNLREWIGGNRPCDANGKILPWCL